VAVATLGCKVNTFESRLIAESLRRRHWQVVDAREDADLLVINTCTVTAEADRQARQLVRRTVRRNPEAKVVVTGCYAQMDPEACAAIPGVDLVLGNDRKLDLADFLPDLAAGRLSRVMVGDLDANVSLPSELLPGIDGQVRAFVQIQQGCDQGCTFCIIHRARGPSRSLAPSLVRGQVNRLLDNGYGEVVLCGVDLGSYGQDLEQGRVAGSERRGFGLCDLIESLLEREGDFRIRLSSIDPAHLDDRLIALLASSPRLCPHLHLSLQSGNTLILKRMKRRYTAEQALERVAALRAAIPGLVLSADVMVGFPTETEAHFEDTVAVVRAMRIAFPHVFAYSARRGTPAARIPRQVPVGERRARSRSLRAVGDEIRAALLRSRVGDSARILLESPLGGAGGGFRGRAADYLPCRVAAADLAWGVTPGDWLDVRYAATDGETLFAAPVAPPLH
jgi:threonylcarbamoyladenosine tRNA methylthiotransferase MtaB